jgi:hypothetical protein
MRRDRTIPPSQIRVGDLRDCHAVHAMCGSCGHFGPVQNARIKRGRPAKMLLSDLALKMKCTKCGAKGAQKLSVAVLPNHA